MDGTSFLPEFDHEMAATRRALERIPDDRLGFRPHARSWTLGQLGGHIAQLPFWCSTTIETDQLDLAQTEHADELDSTAAILQRFDSLREKARTALTEASQATLAAPWTLRSGEHEIFTMPRRRVLRSFVLNHLIHHRGQLTVYLRLVDVPVPGLYGPSADER